MRRLLTVAAAGYALYGVAVIVFILMMMNTVVRNWSWITNDASFSISSLVPAITFLIIAVALVVMLFVLSYLLMKRRKRKTSLVLAAISCVGIPIGTILGAFTIFALTRKGVKQEYSS